MVNGELLTEVIEELYQELVINKNDFIGFVKKGMDVLKSLK